MRIENIGGVAVSRERPFLILEAGVNRGVAIHFPEGEYLKGLVLRRLT